jgi:carbamate kinase
VNAEMKKKLAVIAVGGNALIREPGKESIPEQYEAACLTMHYVTAVIRLGWDVILTHGNGPQVGFVLQRSDLTAGKLFSISLDHCGSNTQGSIGYMFQMGLENEFRRLGMKKQAVTVVTETFVDRNDPAFENPSKPIGSFMDEAVAKKHRDEQGWAVVEDTGRGWRRVVASPKPVRIVQQHAITTLARAGFTVIGVGGGGIPVMENDRGDLVGAEAVVDKDLASALLAYSIGVDLFMIITGVEKVALNFNRPEVQWIDRLTVSEAGKHVADGHFGKGSMEPKILAMLKYLEHGGKRALITNPENMVNALLGKTGTEIVP